MKRLVLVLALALVLVGSASAEPLATYNHTFEFGGSGSGSGSVVSSITSEVHSTPSSIPEVNLGRSYLTVYILDSYAETHDYVYVGVSTNSGFLSAQLPLSDDYLLTNPTDNSRSYRYSYVDYFGLPVYTGSLNYVSESLLLPDGNTVEISDFNFKEYYGYCQYSWIYPNQFNSMYRVSSIESLYFSLEPFGGSESLEVFSTIEVQEPWFDLFGMRGLSTTFTPSNPDEDYYILFAGSDSWVAENPDKWIWTRVHGSTNKYKIIFSGNEYTWFVKYNDEIQKYTFNYTGNEGVVPPVIVPDPEPEPPEPKPPVDTPGDIDPNIPSMPDIESPDLTLDFTSAFDDYENMTIYRDFRIMVNGFTTSIMPDISTTEFYGYLQQVIAYLQLTMEQLREKYAVPIYNIFASVSAFIPSVCWLVVDVAIIFGLFRFMVHILTGPISTAIRERF